MDNKKFWWFTKKNEPAEDFDDYNNGYYGDEFSQAKQPATEGYESYNDSEGDVSVVLSGDPSKKEPVFKSMKKRLPWLLVLLGLGMLVSGVVGLFEQVVAQDHQAIRFLFRFQCHSDRVEDRILIEWRRRISGYDRPVVVRQFPLRRLLRQVGHHGLVVARGVGAAARELCDCGTKRY